VALSFRPDVDLEDRAPLASGLDGLSIEGRRVMLHDDGPEDRLDLAGDLLERMA
jgi:transcription-repair coupling factor (superfamily II helicase)